MKRYDVMMVNPYNPDDHYMAGENMGSRAAYRVLEENWCDQMMVPTVLRHGTLEEVHLKRARHLGIVKEYKPVYLATA